MLAGAIQQYLKAQGLTPVSVPGFPDFTGATGYAVRAEPRTDAEFTGGAYFASVQIRTRAADIVRAEAAGRSALTLVLAADGLTLLWDDPVSPANDKSYRLEAISIVNRPTWYPTVEIGEETSTNCSMFVTEV